MTYIITEPCIDKQDKSCVDVCPVDCIHETGRMLVIDSEECIDCGACEPECPVEAIFAEDDVPDAQQDFIKLNAELAKTWKPLIEKKDEPPGADEFSKIKDKRQFLER